MTKQVIGTGASANDKKGDSLRAAFTKVNANFTELYTAIGLDSGGLNIGAFEFTGSVMTTTDSSSIVIDQATTVTGDLTVGGDLLPNNDLQVNLGSPSKKWHSLYVGTGSVYIGNARLSLEGGTLNSSVGFSTDSLTIGGNLLTVNPSGVLESTGGIAGSVTSDRLINGNYEAILNDTGALFIPGGSIIKTTNDNLVDSITTQVVWSSTEQFISGAKLMIQVEADETGGNGNWETQVCEAVIAVRGYSSTSIPVISVYGVTHTSVAPLMTFTAQRNSTTRLIEVIGTRSVTASPNGNASLRIYSVETGTND